eukprot:COSAG06_NODE_1_length_58652_cov_31.600967_24_plen_230_part_00
MGVRTVPIVATTCCACIATAVVAAMAAGSSDLAESCDQALYEDCDAARRQGTFRCGTCAGAAQHDLEAAGCNSTYMEKFCANQTCVLGSACGDARAQGPWECAVCVGQHSANISHCTKEQEQSYCKFEPSPPTPPPPPPWAPGGCCTQCPYKGLNTKCMGIHANRSFGRCNNTHDPHASCQLPGWVQCVAACSMSGSQAFCENHAPCKECAAYVYPDVATCKTPCNRSC